MEYQEGGSAGGSEVQDPPQMSEAATITSIFFEPGKVFEDLKRKPRFVIAGVIIAILITGYAFGLYYKVGEAGVRSYISDQFDKSPRTQGLTAEQKNNAI